MRLAVVRDFRAEGWPSMDLCADQLLAHLPDWVRAVEVAPEFRHVLGHLIGVGGSGFKADRLLNRHLLLPQTVRRLTRDNDFVHIADHSYAHLALALPQGRVGVYCHDLDAFRCVLEPETDPRPRWFRAIAGRILAGLKRAIIVFHSTGTVRADLLRHRLVRPDRLVHAPYGVAAEFAPTATAPVELPARIGRPFLLHVGGDMPRKRLDVLFDVFAAVRLTRPDVTLVQVGPPWSAERLRQMERLGIAAVVMKMTGLSRPQLTELYRRAAAVLVPSEAEGFGLPVIEALACGAAVIASDIPVLREVGGAVCSFAPVGDVPGWASAVLAVQWGAAETAARQDRVAWAARFAWGRHAATIADAYRNLAVATKFHSSC